MTPRSTAQIAVAIIAVALIAFLAGQASVDRTPEIAPRAQPPVAAPLGDAARSPGASVGQPIPTRVARSPANVLKPTSVPPPTSPVRPTPSPTAAPTPSPLGDTLATPAHTAAPDVVPSATAGRPSPSPTATPAPPRVAETVAVSAQTAAQDDVAELSIDALIAQTRAPAWKDRWDAVNELGYRKDMRTIPALAERALFDDNPHPRWRSLWALASVERSGATVKPLLLAGLDDPGPIVVRNAAVALSFLGFEEARPELLNGLSDPDNYRRWEAVFSIKKVPSPEVAAALIPLLDPSHEPADNVRSEAALSLGRIGSDLSVQPLLTTLETDPVPGVRRRAAMALSRLGQVDQFERLLQSESDEQVRKVLQDAVDKLKKSE